MTNTTAPVFAVAPLVSPQTRDLVLRSSADAIRDLARDAQARCARARTREEAFAASGRFDGIAFAWGVFSGLGGDLDGLDAEIGRKAMAHAAHAGIGAFLTGCAAVTAIV